VRRAGAATPTPALLQALTLAELDSRAAEAKDAIATRYQEFAKYRDEALELLRAADERVQTASAVCVWLVVGHLVLWVTLGGARCAGGAAPVLLACLQLVRSAARSAC
jgi:hypothetical protein